MHEEVLIIMIVFGTVVLIVGMSFLYGLMRMRIRNHSNACQGAVMQSPSPDVDLADRSDELRRRIANLEEILLKGASNG